MPDRVEIERQEAVVIRRTYADMLNEKGKVVERLVDESAWNYHDDLDGAIAKHGALIAEAGG